MVRPLAAVSLYVVIPAMLANFLCAPLRKLGDGVRSYRPDAISNILVNAILVILSLGLRLVLRLLFDCRITFKGKNGFSVIV